MPDTDTNFPKAGIKLFPEIIARIASFLDVHSALAFARAERSFTPLVDPVLWRELPLYVPEAERSRISERAGEGRPPSSDPDPTAVRHPYKDSRSELFDHQMASFLRARVTSVLENGIRHPNRWKLVQSVVLQTGNGASGPQTQVLERTSPFVQRLELVRQHNADRSDNPDLPRESFEVRLLDLRTDLLRCGQDLRFASLMIFKARLGGMQYMGFLILLLEIAPQLETVDVAICSRYTAHELNWDPDIEEEGRPANLEEIRWRPHFPTSLTAPHDHLRKLAITYYGAEDEHAHGYNVLPWLFSQCPQIQQLVINIEDDEEEEITQGYMTSHIQHMRNLNDMVTCLHEFEHRAEGSFPELRRILLESQFHSLPCSAHQDPWPLLPNAVETLFLNNRERTYRVPINPSSHKVDSVLAGWVRQNPKLHQIYYLSIRLDGQRGEDLFNSIAAMDDMEETEAPAVAVRSIRGPNEANGELLDIEILVCDAEHPTTSEDVKMLHRVMRLNSTRRELSSAPTLVQRFTEFDDEEVPLSIINQVRQAEGPVPDGHWERRGVDVGERAWKVLTDWRESLRV